MDDPARRDGISGTGGRKQTRVIHLSLVPVTPDDRADEDMLYWRSCCTNLSWRHHQSAEGRFKLLTVEFRIFPVLTNHAHEGAVQVRQFQPAKPGDPPLTWACKKSLRTIPMPLRDRLETAWDKNPQDRQATGKTRAIGERPIMNSLRFASSGQRCHAMETRAPKSRYSADACETYRCPDRLCDGGHPGCKDPARSKPHSVN